MQNKSIAFIISYLLGADEEYLRDNFKLDWEKSCKCTRFENYVDANTLRELCRVRFSILRNPERYDAKEIPTYIQKSVDYLTQKGIEITKGLNTLSTWNFFNFITDMINVITYKCLVDLDIPQSDILESLFSFPVMQEKDFQQLIENFNTVNPMNGIFVFCSERIKETFTRSFLNDRNMFYSFYSLQNKRVSKDIPKYVANYREIPGIDIDESIYIDTKAILNTLYTRNDTYWNGQYIGTKMDIEVLDMQTRKQVEKAFEMSDYLKVKDLKLFVDCDNIEFFKFLGFLNTLSPENVSGIVLIVDEKSNYLWRVFDKIYKGSIPVKSISVPRLKEQKSVVDVVLTKEICKSVYCDGLDKVLLISSDSDFFGLISSLIDVDFGVCFVSSAMGVDYLKYLENNNIPTMDLLTVEDDCSTDEVKEIGFSYLLLYELSNVPMTYWTVNSLSDLLYNSFTNETDISVTKQEIKKFIGNKFDKVYVDIRDDNTYVCLGNFEIKIA